MKTHLEYMELALAEAKKAAALGEIPVGCVIIDDNGNVIAAAHNLTEQGDALAHAEILAIQAAEKALGARRLQNCTLYVTLEPCPMCAGAILLARLKLVVFGARDWERGGLLSNYNLASNSRFGSIPVLEGFGEEQASALLKEFFAKKR